MTKQTPLLVITGPTASGKSALALSLARRYGGEIVCADSRTVYRGLDIGTAKPTMLDREQVPHHMLDIVWPDERFTAYDFQQQALVIIDSIRRRGNIPMLVGGTGLYVDSVVLQFNFGPNRQSEQRQTLEILSILELQKMLKKLQIPLPENCTNKRYLVRAIERASTTQYKLSMPDAHTFVVAIATEKHELRSRIDQRIDVMFHDGVIDEALRVAGRYGWDSEALSGNIYRSIKTYLEGGLSYDELIRHCRVQDWRLAKRQMTWLRRHTFVRWADVASAEHYFNHILRDYRD